MTTQRDYPEGRLTDPVRRAERVEEPATGRVGPSQAVQPAEPISHGGRWWRRWLGGWLLLLISLGVAAVTGYGIMRVHDYAAQRGRLNALLGRIETGSRHQSALEWQAVAEGRLTPELAQQRQAVDATLHDLLTRLRASDPDSSAAQAVSDTFGVYDAAVNDQFQLLAQGELAEAEEVDEQRVDPAFDRLAETLAATGRHYGAVARQANRQADLGTLLLLMVAAAVIGLLVWRFQRVKSQAAELFAHQARHDALTALPNRALLVERLRMELARAARRREPVFLLWLDLDDFKVVNDSLGHQAGDQLLVEVGERLRACLRPGDTPARMGGDEFTVLLADVDGCQGAVRVAERVGAELGVPFEVAGHQVVVRASIGIAESVPGTTSVEALLRNADIAMYEAKKLGKGQYQLFAPGMDQAAWKRLELEAELRLALEEQQFELYYQPILDLDGGAVTELEALVRWDHPIRGLIPPADFIPLAEETGLIVPLGEWVLDQACQQLRAWEAGGQVEPSLGLSVNLSPRQLREPELPRRVAQALARSELDPGRLTLEITETSVVDDLDRAEATLAALRELGVHVAVDDFGTGFSALGALKHYPVDSLKIDRSFVDGLGRDAQDTAIVHAVIAFAKTLGLRVTGEGIETAQQFEQLRALGCDHGQGYYFAKPLQPGSVQSFLASRQRVSADQHTALGDP
jgi:diguanylate cyclase